MPRHNDYSNSEMRDMICIYAQVNFNSRAASRRYQQQYPNRRQPDRNIFQRLYGRLGETGSFRPKSHIGRPKAVTVEQEEEILVRVSENPRISTRQLANSTHVRKTSILKILHAEKLYPYHLNPVQHLLPADLPARLQFCRFLLNSHNNDPAFINRILFTDEATFTRRGVLNWRNNHSWELDNPHLTIERHFQQEFSINIWCGIIDNVIIGPYELPGRLNGNQYLQFLQNDLPNLLDDVPLNLRQNMWFMHDGAPPHYPAAVRNFLDEWLSRRWFGRGSEFPWPPRSPDLNPLDFFLWGYIKSLVYTEEIRTREQLLQRIHDAVDTIRNKQETLFQVSRHLVKGLRKCIHVNGGHFAHLLK